MAQIDGYDPLIAHLTGPCQSCTALQKRVKELENAVEWALLPSTQFLLDVEMGSAFRDELRRRAGRK